MAGEVVNVDMAAAWDGDEGDDWADQWEHHDRVVRGHHEALLAAAAFGPATKCSTSAAATGNDPGRGARRDGRVGAWHRPVEPHARAAVLAAGEGLTNVAFEQADAQVHRFEPDSDDVAVSRFGGDVLRGPRRRLRQHPRRAASRRPPGRGRLARARRQRLGAGRARRLRRRPRSAGSPVRRAGTVRARRPGPDDRPAARGRLRGRRDHAPSTRRSGSGPTSTTRSRSSGAAESCGASARISTTTSGNTRSPRSRDVLVAHETARRRGARIGVVADLGPAPGRRAGPAPGRLTRPGAPPAEVERDCTSRRLAGPSTRPSRRCDRRRRRPSCR